MIYVFTGKNGSGKTFNMVALAYKRWLQGCDIYTNTYLNFQIPKYRIRKIEVGKIIYFHDIRELIEVRDGLILFDEAQNLFDAQNWSSLPPEFKFKLQQHRHHNLDIFATTQVINQIDIVYRRLLHHWFYYHKFFSLFGFQFIHESYKDVSFLYKDNTDLTVPDLSVRLSIITPWSKRLYDTLFDVGYKKILTKCNYSKNKLIVEMSDSHLYRRNA